MWGAYIVNGTTDVNKYVRGKLAVANSVKIYDEKCALTPTDKALRLETMSKF